MIHAIRLWVSILILLVVQSCDVVDRGNSASGEIKFDEQTTLKLGAPSILRNARSVDTDVLSVQVDLSYNKNGEPVNIGQTVSPSKSGSGVFWKIGIDVPANTPFVLSMTWFEEGTPRLELIQITREFDGYSGNSGVVGFSYDFSATAEYSTVEGAPDYAGFDSDGDSMTNLDERLAESNPFRVSGNFDKIQALVAVPISLNLKALVNAAGSNTILLSDSSNSNRSFVASSLSPWLTLAPGSGDIAANETFELAVSHTCDAVAGEFSGSVELMSNGLTTSIPVTLSCQDVTAALLSGLPPELKLEVPTSSAGMINLTFENTGNADLNYDLTTDTASSGWLTSNKSEGLVTPGTTESIEITAACGTAAEQRVGVLSLNSNAGDDTMAVNVLVNCSVPPTVLVVQQETLNINAQVGASAGSSFAVQNTGNTPLDFTVDADDNWLSVEPKSGSIAAESSAIVAVSAQCAAGISERTTKLTVDSAGGSDTVSITQNCVEASMPILSGVSTNLILDASAGEDKSANISLSNSGNSTLTYEAKSENGWLEVQAAQAIGSIAANASKLVPIVAKCQNIIGTRNGRVAIESDGGEETVNVSLKCQGPSLSNVRPQSLDLSAELSQSTERDVSFSNSGTAPLTFNLAADKDWITIRVPDGQVEPELTQRIGISAVCGTSASTRNGTLQINTDGGNDTVSVTQTCTAPSAAELAVTPANLSLAAQIGQAANSNVSVSNTGNSALNFTIESNSTWLSVGTGSGNTVTGSVGANDSTSVPVTAQCPAGSAGDLSGVLSVTGNGGRDSVTVTVKCTAASVPVLSGVTESLSLSAQLGQSESGAINLSNSGNANLIYSVSSNRNWLTVDTAGGTITPGDFATVPVNATCGNDTGNRTGTLSITSENNGGSATVPVTINCTAEPKPVLSKVTPSLALTAQVAQSRASQISFSNSGNAPLNYTVSSNQSWLTIGKGSGTATATGTIAAGNSTDLEVLARCGNAATNRSATLSITSENNGGSATIPVTLNCTAESKPVLSNVTPSLSLAAQVSQSRASQISFSNSGNAPLNYSVSSNQTWLTIGKGSGTATVSGTLAAGNSANVEVLAQCGNAATNRRATLSITSENNGGSATVPVTLNCTSAPAPEISKVTPDLTLAALTGQSDTSEIQFSNSGNAVLNYTVSSNRNWLSFGTGSGSNTLSGTLAANNERTVRVVGQCGTAASPRTGTITIASDTTNESATVPVTMNCTARPVLSVTPQSLDLSAETGQQERSRISLSNTGGGSIEYVVSSNQSWLTLPAANGPNGTVAGTLTTSATDNVVVNARCASAEGVRSGSLTVATVNGDTAVPVTLRCTAPAAPVLSKISPTKLSFRARVGQSDSGTVSFSNSGNADMTAKVSSSSSSSMLRITPADEQTLAPGDTTTVSIVARCGDKAGSFSETLTIDTNANDGSVPVDITCNPTPGPVLSNVTPANFSFNVGVPGTDTGRFNFTNSGGSNLNYRIISNSQWLTVQGPTGILAPGAVATKVLTADCSSAGFGPNDGVLTIGGDGGTETIDVSLLCLTGEIGNVRPRSLDLVADTGQSASSQFGFTNTGDAAISYRITLEDPKDSLWLSAQNPSGDLPVGSRRNVTVVGTCGASAQSFGGNLLVTSIGVGQTVRVPVTLQCNSTNRPILSDVTPDQVSLTEQSGRSGIMEISFSNIGNALLTYSGVQSPTNSWIGIGGSGTTLAPNETGKKTIVATCEDDFIGELNGSYNITSDGGNATVPIKLTCTQPGVLESVTPTRLDLQASPGIFVSATLTVSNSSSTAELHYAAGRIPAEQTGPDSWLKASQPRNGSPIPPNSTSSVFVRAECLAVNTGDVTGEVFVRSNGGNTITVPVTLSCGTPNNVPEISPSSLNLVASPGQSNSASLVVTNVGNTDMVYTASSSTANGPINWLTVSRPASNSPIPQNGGTGQVSVMGNCPPGFTNMLSAAALVVTNGETTRVPVSLDCSTGPF